MSLLGALFGSPFQNPSPAPVAPPAQTTGTNTVTAPATTAATAPPAPNAVEQTSATQTTTATTTDEGAGEPSTPPPWYDTSAVEPEPAQAPPPPAATAPAQTATAPPATTTDAPAAAAAFTARIPEAASGASSEDAARDAALAAQKAWKTVEAIGTLGAMAEAPASPRTQAPGPVASNSLFEAVKVVRGESAAQPQPLEDRRYA